MLSQHLSNFIKVSMDAVDSHPQHHLNLGYRWALYSAMGPRQDENINAVDELGHKRRTHLAIQTAKRVLPLWQEGPLELPADNLRKFYNEISGITWNEERYQPAYLLQLANQIMLGLSPITKEDFMYAESTFSYYDYFEYYYQEREDLRYMYAGTCAAQAFWVAVNDEIFDGEIDFILTEDDLKDPTYKTEASFFASIAYAGGTIWNHKSNNQKRLEFWKWWLTEAMPAAWLAFS
jgi:hypothetical protein